MFGRVKYRCELVVDADPDDAPRTVLNKATEQLTDSDLDVHIRDYADSLDLVGSPTNPKGYAFWFILSTDKKSDVDPELIKELVPYPTIVKRL